MTTLQASAQNQLRQFVEQLERLEEEKKALGADIRDKFAEAKAAGFDVKVLKRLLKLRKMDPDDRDEEDAILATYMHALGMEGTPLDEWAKKLEGQVTITGATVVALEGMRAIRERAAASAQGAPAEQAGE